EGEKPLALIIDLDGAKRRAGPLEPALRRANLMRLYRSSQKLARAGGAAPSLADLVRFASAYTGHDEAALRALAGPLPSLRWRRLLWAATRAQPSPAQARS